MNRFHGLTLLVALSTAMPGAVLAQKNSDSKYTKDASKYLAMAMVRSDKASRTQMYQQALAALQEGFTKDADNAKLWFTAGQAYVGLGDYIAADSCFSKAEKMVPSLKEEIDGERESGWMAAFQDGVDLMDQQQYEKALSTLEAAQKLYDKRPEALLNIGSIQANLGHPDEAEKAFQEAIKAAQGELVAKLDSGSQVTWKRYVEMATINIAQIRGTKGVDEFQANNYDGAAEAFKKAIEVNPYSRDYLFNYVQARYAKATKYEDEVEQDPSKAAQYKQPLIDLYSELKTEIPKVREYDPTNESLMLVLQRATRREGELKGDTATARNAALVILTTLDSIPVEVTDLAISAEDTIASVTGKVKNKKLAPNTPVTVKISLLGYQGSNIGEMTVTVNVGDKDSSTPFEQKGAISGQVAGWKYRITS